MYNSNKFNNLYGYEGELGALYSKDKTRFVLWAPTATNVSLLLINKEKDNETIKMEKHDKGTWVVEVEGDLHEQYYNYLVEIDGDVNEVVDPYAKAVGVNGLTSMVVDLERTNPEGFKDDKRPELDRIIDSVLYEMHIRDFSIDDKSGVNKEYRGKYKGVWQEETTNPGSKTKT